MAGTREEYDKVISLLTTLRDKIQNGSISFKALGSDLIDDLIKSSFGHGDNTAENTARQAFADANVRNYELICGADNRQLETAFFDTIISGMGLWKEIAAALKDDLDEAKDIQRRVVPYKEGDGSDDRHIIMDVRELFLQQNNSMTGIDYQRLDVVIKYLAIENHFGRNDYGMKLYKKLQAHRSKIMKGVPEGYEDSGEKVFGSLIDSIAENGFDTDSEITCEAGLSLMDGAHRLAACLYFGIPEIRVRVLKDRIAIEPSFNEEYIRSGDFTEEEIRIIRETTATLINRCKVGISCILWPPVCQYFDKITMEIASVFKVTEIKDFEYSNETFPRVVRGVYNVDDIEQWKIDRKIQAMSRFTLKRVRVLKLDMTAPRFRLKELNNNTISETGERLKNIIRSKYKEQVPDYIYDIIVHTADNYRQSEYMDKLFSKAVKLDEYLKGIGGMKYVLIKHDTPYMTPDFPETYPFSKDIDIVCDCKDYNRIVEYTGQVLSRIEGYELKHISYEGRDLFRLELSGFLIIQFDISVGMDGISQDFWRDVMDNRCSRGIYYIPQTAHEVCIRICEYLKNPAKKHHLQYLIDNKDYIDSDYASVMVDGVDRKKINELIASIKG